MQIPKKYKHEYVCCLPKPLEKRIMAAVSKNISAILLNEEEKEEAVENANCSKVCDLEDTIQIEYV